MESLHIHHQKRMLTALNIELWITFNVVNHQYGFSEPSKWIEFELLSGGIPAYFSLSAGLQKNAVHCAKRGWPSYLTIEH